MHNTFQAAQMIKDQGKIILPFPPDLDIAYIDVRDTAAVAVEILMNPKPYIGQTFDLTGVISTFGNFAQVFSQVFSKVLGKPVTYVHASLEQAEQALKGRGLPDWLVSHQLGMARLAMAGGFSAEHSQEIRDLTGHEPRTLENFVTDHKALFN